MVSVRGRGERGEGRVREGGFAIVGVRYAMVGETGLWAIQSFVPIGK